MGGCVRKEKGRACVLRKVGAMQSGSKAASKVKNLYDTVGAIHESPVLPWFGGRFTNRPYRFAKNLYCITPSCRRPPAGVVSYGQGVGEEQRWIAPLIGRAAHCSRAFEKQARRGAPEPPSRRRSALRQGSRRGATMDCAAYRARSFSAIRRAVSHTVPPSALTAMSAYFS